MKIIYKINTIIILLLLTTGNGFAAESASEVLAEAKTMYKQADKMQGAWITTKKLISKAEQQIKSGNEKSALKIAQQARFEAKRSVEQAQQQMSNWSEPGYLK